MGLQGKYDVKLIPVGIFWSGKNAKIKTSDESPAGSDYGEAEEDKDYESEVADENQSPQSQKSILNLGFNEGVGVVEQNVGLPYDIEVVPASAGDSKKSS